MFLTIVWYCLQLHINSLCCYHNIQLSQVILFFLFTHHIIIITFQVCLIYELLKLITLHGQLPKSLSKSKHLGCHPFIMLSHYFDKQNNPLIHLLVLPSKLLCRLNSVIGKTIITFSVLSILFCALRWSILRHHRVYVQLHKL